MTIILLYTIYIPLKIQFQDSNFKTRFYIHGIGPLTGLEYYL